MKYELQQKGMNILFWMDNTLKINNISCPYLMLAEDKKKGKAT
jgi:hypothetical protein